MYDNQNYFQEKNLPIAKASDFYSAFLSCPLVQNIWSKSKCMLTWHPSFRHKTGRKRDSKTCLDMLDGLRCSGTGTNYGKLHRCKSEICKYKITITRSSKQLNTFFFHYSFVVLSSVSSSHWILRSKEKFPSLRSRSLIFWHSLISFLIGSSLANISEKTFQCLSPVSL